MLNSYKKFTAVLLSVLLLASSLPISAMAAEASGVSEAVAADIVKTEPETTDSVTQPIENTTTAEKTAVDEKPTEATPAKAAEPVGAKQEEQPVGKSSFTYTVANNQVTMMIHGVFYLSCTFMPITGMFLKMTSGGDGIGGRLALVAWCVYFLPIGILSFLHYRKR